jgi:2-dehydro-3-deoxyphosphogluconate aldolase / (4S)-4-hydroxy-2-oxoglutarate aldolase
MNRQEIRTRIEETGIIPAIRISSAEGARFAAEAVAAAGIPIVELTMTVPGALDVIADLARHSPRVMVGAGTVLDLETARACVDAGAMFLTSPGLDLALVEFALKEGVVVFPGALTPTEILTAWRAGSDFVKVFPCAEVGGANYIRAVKAPFPQVPLIAAGGVNQKTAGEFILAGASALGIGADLIPPEAIRLRQADWICELAHRFSHIVKSSRAQRMGH